MNNNFNKKEVTKIIKKNNKVIGYEISNEFVPKDKAIDMAKNGELKNVIIAHRKDTVYLKGIPDGNDSNNIL